jgi:hypothetical protein
MIPLYGFGGPIERLRIQRPGSFHYPADILRAALKRKSAYLILELNYATTKHITVTAHLAMSHTLNLKLPILHLASEIQSKQK